MPAVIFWFIDGGIFERRRKMTYFRSKNSRWIHGLIIFAMCLGFIMPVSFDTASAWSKPGKAKITALASPDQGYITVSWGRKSCTGYQVRVGTNKKLTKNRRTVKFSGKDNITQTITGLKAGTKYYVKVRAYKKKGKKTKYGKWSSGKSIRTHIHSYGTTTTAATCGSRGVRTISCSCGNGTRSYQIIEPAHTYSGKLIKIVDDSQAGAAAERTAGAAAEQTAETAAAEQTAETAAAEQTAEAAAGEQTAETLSDPDVIEVKKSVIDSYTADQLKAKIEPQGTCTECGASMVKIETADGVTVTCPTDTDKAAVTLTVQKKDGTLYKYKIYAQGDSANYFTRADYFKSHGCSTCTVTSLLNAMAPAVQDYSPDNVVDYLEPAIFGPDAFNSNFSRILTSQMPISMYGITRMLDYYGISYTHRWYYSSDEAAIAEIEEHLKTGDPVIVTTTKLNGDTKWAGSKHTMLLVALLGDDKALLCDPANKTVRGRLKVASLKDLMNYSYSAYENDNNYLVKKPYFTSTNSTLNIRGDKYCGTGGYILVK